MNLGRLSLVVLVGAAFFPAILPAQTSNNPVRIIVERGERIDTRAARTIPPAQHRTQAISPLDMNPVPALPMNTAAIYYHIRVSNIGVKPLTNLVVKWSILWTDATGRDSLTEGEQTCAIAPVKICEFDTKDIWIRPTSRKGSGRIIAEQTADVVGYLVEAFLDGKSVNAVSLPTGIRSQVERLRAK